MYSCLSVGGEGGGMKQSNTRSVENGVKGSSFDGSWEANRRKKYP